MDANIHYFDKGSKPPCCGARRSKQPGFKSHNDKFGDRAAPLAVFCRAWPSLPLVPLYYLLASVAAWMALYDLISRPYHWHKTKHGLAKTTRQGAPLERATTPVRC
jgi:hypothetical protein